MKLASWNVNGLRAVISKGKLTEYLVANEPDILCLQEVKAKESQLPELPAGYQLFLNSAERPGYSGTGFLVKNDLAARLDSTNFIRNLPADIESDFSVASDSFGNPNREGRVFVVDLGKFYLATVYTPNSKGDLSRLALRHEQWDPAFLGYMNELRQSKPVIFCGDLNVAANEIDLANPKQNVGKHGFTTEERQGFNNFIASGFVDSFRHINGDIAGAYTWWTHWAKSRERNVGWRIDYFLVDSRLQAQIAGARIIAQQLGSDHCPIEVDILDD